MAAGEIIPWTDPGGDPCCCADACFTDLANEPKEEFVDGTYIQIDAAEYASLFAGGTYTADFSIDVLANSYNAIGGLSTQQHTASGIGIELLSHASIPSGDRPCYDRFISDELAVTRTRNFSTGGSSVDSYVTRLLFYRSLGTENGNNFVSFTTCASPTEQKVIVDDAGVGGQIGFCRLQGVGLFDFPAFVTFVAGNTEYGIEHLTGNNVFNSCGGTFNDPFLPTVPSIDVNVSVSLEDSVLVPVGLAAKACAYTSLYSRLFLGGSPTFTMSGSFSMNVIFTPSAP